MARRWRARQSLGALGMLSLHASRVWPCRRAPQGLRLCAKKTHVSPGHTCVIKVTALWGAASASCIFPTTTAARDCRPAAGAMAASARGSARATQLIAARRGEGAARRGVWARRLHAARWLAAMQRLQKCLLRDTCTGASLSARGDGGAGMNLSATETPPGRWSGALPRHAQ